MGQTQKNLQNVSSKTNYIDKFILNVNGLNILSKKGNLSDWIGKKFTKNINTQTH